MSARVPQVDFMAATAFVPASIFVTTAHHGSPVAVPNGQTHARIFPVVVVSGDGPFTSYPPKHGADTDEQLVYSYASFREDPITALSVNTRCNDTWTLCIAVPIPERLRNPTLLALDYMIKYATTNDNGNSTIQTDTLLTRKVLPEGVVTRTTDFGIYNNETGYGPLMVNHDATLRLSTNLAIKGNGVGEQWSHYVDNQHIAPNVRIVAESHLYMVFHVSEYPTAKTIRSLSIEISATWQKEEVERKAQEETERKAKEEAEKKAKEEAERKAREPEERQAREEERLAREEERRERQEAKQAREEERQARQEERQTRQEENQAREQERQEREVQKRAREAEIVAKAPATADEELQSRIDKRVTELGLKKCDQGLPYKKTEEGYVCTGGGHKITFKQLGLF